MEILFIKTTNINERSGTTKFLFISGILVYLSNQNYFEKNMYIIFERILIFGYL